MTLRAEGKMNTMGLNLLFDLDGTLTDPFDGITRSIVHALSELGRRSPPQGELAWCIGPPLRDSFATLLQSTDPSLLDRAIGLYRERFADIGLYENAVYPEIPEALETLRARGHRIFVATSKPRLFAERIVTHFGLRSVERVYGSELDGTRVAKADLIAYILAQESLVATDTRMLGDREHDMIGARANGICGIGVLWGYGRREELEAAGACGCVSSPGDLLISPQLSDLRAPRRGDQRAKRRLGDRRCNDGKGQCHG